MPLPTLKELLERFPDGFYGCFAANWSEMDYKTRRQGWRQDLLRVYSGGYSGDASALLNLRQTLELWTVRTGFGSLPSVGRARSMKLGS